MSSVQSSSSQSDTDGVVRDATGECVGSFQPTLFEADVIVEFEVNDSNITETELRALELAFETSYNAQTAQLCDSEYRQIFETEIFVESINTASNIENEFLDILDARDASNRHRKLQRSRSRRRIPFRFHVRGTCRACALDSNLFQDVINLRRDLQTAFQSIHDKQIDENRVGNNHRDLQVPLGGNVIINRPFIGSGSGGGGAGIFTEGLRRSPTPAPFFQGNEGVTIGQPRSCDCVNPRAADRAPSTVEFVQNFDETVARSTDIVTVEAVVESTEVDQETCTEVFNSFQSDIFIEVVGNPDNITDNDLELLALEALLAYNSLSDDTCDPQFRDALQAKVVVDDTLDTGGARRNLQGATRTRSGRRRYRLGTTITGRCLGCISDSRLFDDVTLLRRDRHLVEVDGTFNDRIFTPDEIAVMDREEIKRRRLGFLGRTTYPSSTDTLDVNARTPRRLGFIQEGLGCFCKVGAARSTPTEAQFTSTLGQNVRFLNQEGFFSNADVVTRVDVTVQIDETMPSTRPSGTDTDPPTAFPTPVPTPRPSASPSISQVPTNPPPTESPAPSPSPSNVPSITPSTSTSPTGSPSRSPTRNPAFVPTESPAPSPSPSQSPTM